jgi:hypothetical protein
MRANRSGHNLTTSLNNQFCASSEVKALITANSPIPQTQQCLAATVGLRAAAPLVAVLPDRNPLLLLRLTLRDNSKLLTHQLLTRRQLPGQPRPRSSKAPGRDCLDRWLRLLRVLRSVPRSVMLSVVYSLEGQVHQQRPNRHLLKPSPWTIASTRATPGPTLPVRRMCTISANAWTITRAI